MKDELAERRSAKGLLTIKIGAGTSSIVRQVQTRPANTSDPVAHLRRIAARVRERNRLELLRSLAEGGPGE